MLYICYLLWNDLMCILLYMIMCMLLSATSTHFKWELMLYCLHCPTLNKVLLLLLLVLLLLLHNQYWNFVNWTFRKNIQYHFHRISYIFNHENIFENVCKMAAILSRPQFLAASIDHDTTRHDNTCVTHVKYCIGHIFTHWCRHKWRRLNWFSCMKIVRY